MVGKTFRLMLVVCTLALMVGCKGSPVRDCWEDTDGLGKVKCGTLILPVLGPFLPDDKDDAPSE